MTKADIISRTLRDEMERIPPDREPSSDEREYEEIVIAELNRRLPDGVDIKTCDDFRPLNVGCCETCHHFYSHYEMKLIDLPDGGKAWVCDAVMWAVYPGEYRKLQEWWRNSPRGKLLRERLLVVENHIQK